VAGVTTPIVALDVPTASAARALMDLLGDECRFYKVGSELFTAAGPDVLQMLRAAGCEVFLDLKFHDIPNTVRSAARSAAGLGAALLTVHASGGRDMMEAAVEGAGDTARVLAVTILTSHSAESVGEAWGRKGVEVIPEVLRLAHLARRAGASGVVCSGREAAVVRMQEGEGFQLLVPGVRLPGGAAHDQARVVTPSEASAAGAHFIVLGRTVTGAPDPVAALRRVRRELDSAR
jgi:orotidine-5'-phosphate decarboxylase